MRTLEALGGFREGSAFRPWLIRVVVNETRNTVRSAARLRTAGGRPRRPAGAGLPAGSGATTGSAETRTMPPASASAVSGVTAGWWWAIPGPASGAAGAVLYLRWRGSRGAGPGEAGPPEERRQLIDV